MACLCKHLSLSVVCSCYHIYPGPGHPPWCSIYNHSHERDFAVQMCVCFFWLRFIVILRSLPRAVLINLGSGENICILGFFTFRMSVCFFPEKQFTDGIVKLVSTELFFLTCLVFHLQMPCKDRPKKPLIKRLLKERENMKKNSKSWDH